LNLFKTYCIALFAVVNEMHCAPNLPPLNFVLRSLSHEGRAREPTNLSGIINGLNNTLIQAQVYFPPIGSNPPSSRRTRKIKSAPEALIQKRTVSTVPVDPTSFSWWWFSF
jgi:hypothetical protein